MWVSFLKPARECEICIKTGRKKANQKNPTTNPMLNPSLVDLNSNLTILHLMVIFQNNYIYFYIEFLNSLNAFTVQMPTEICTLIPAVLAVFYSKRLWEKNSFLSKTWIFFIFISALDLLKDNSQQSLIQNIVYKKEITQFKICSACTYSWALQL